MRGNRIIPADARGRLALQVIVLLGIVSLFADIVYEGARSITGPYLLLLGAGSLTVSVVAGAGEFLGYGVRLFSGWITDKTRQVWTITIAGYLLTGAIPLLVFAGSWEIAALLLIVERVGKGLRSPAKDTILSHASAPIGHGIGYGIHESLDQVGAIIGPLLFSAAYLLTGGYKAGFAILLVPFLCMASALLLARRKLPCPARLEERAGCESPGPNVDERSFLIPYLLFSFFTMAGFLVFPLIAYHFKAAVVIPDAEIPVLYAVAMAADGVVALIAGRYYDRRGARGLLLVPFLAMLVPLFVFIPASFPAVMGALIWGATMGLQETILRAAIAGHTGPGHRGKAFGLFNTIYGIGWFAGSIATGLLYEYARDLILPYILGMQILAVLFLSLSIRRHCKPGAMLTWYDKGT